MERGRRGAQAVITGRQRSPQPGELAAAPFLQVRAVGPGPGPIPARCSPQEVFFSWGASLGALKSCSPDLATARVAAALASPLWVSASACLL